jgi:hypothetical protein
MSACSITTKADDAKYGELVNKYESMGPTEDPAFQEAISILRKTSPTQLQEELNACKRGGKGKRSRRSRSARRSRRGGVNQQDEGDASAPASAPKPSSSSKTMCYLKAMAKLSAITAMLAGVAFNYIAPFLAEASGVKPCEGTMDQIVGTVASFVWDAADCSAREEQFNLVVTGYTSLIVSVVGVTGLKMVLKSPLAFKLALRYLAARECPEKFDGYSGDQFASDMSKLKEAPVFSMGDWEKDKAAASSQAAAASSQAAAAPAQGLADPNAEVGRRGRKGGVRRTRRAKSHRRRRASARRSHRRSMTRRRSH